MRGYTQAKQTTGGVMQRSHLPIFNYASLDIALDSSPEIDLDESALHSEKYNLANMSISAKLPGNNQRNTAHNSTGNLSIQAKLTIGEPNDKYEQEADRVAQQVVQQINAPKTVQPDQTETIQRKVTPDKDEEDKIQMKPLIQRKSSEGGIAATPVLESSIQKVQNGGQPLADSIRKPMERAFGTDFRQVRVHTDTQSDQLNRSIQAKAFTTRQHVFFRKGAYEPWSRVGQELIAHELSHVVQQGSLVEYKGGHPEKGKRRVGPTDNIIRSRYAPNVQLLSFEKPETSPHHPENDDRKFKLPISEYQYNPTKVSVFPIRRPVAASAFLASGSTNGGTDAVSTPLSVNLIPSHRARGWLYQRCHLIAKCLGGQGRPENIVPGSVGFNQRILKEIESPLKDALNKVSYRRCYDYSVNVEYNGHLNRNLSVAEQLLPTAMIYHLKELKLSSKFPVNGQQTTWNDWEPYRSVTPFNGERINHDLNALSQPLGMQNQQTATFDPTDSGLALLTMEIYPMMNLNYGVNKYAYDTHNDAMRLDMQEVILEQIVELLERELIGQGNGGFTKTDEIKSKILDPVQQDTIWKRWATRQWEKYIDL